MAVVVLCLESLQGRQLPGDWTQVQSRERGSCGEQILPHAQEEVTRVRV